MWKAVSHSERDKVGANVRRFRTNRDSQSMRDSEMADVESVLGQLCAEIDFFLARRSRWSVSLGAEAESDEARVVDSVPQNRD